MRPSPSRKQDAETDQAKPHFVEEAPKAPNRDQAKSPIIGRKHTPIQEFAQPPPGIGQDTSLDLDRADDLLLDMGQVRLFWGGAEPVNAATIYRMIAAGQHPRPIKIGKLSRWLRSELVTERNRRLALRA